MRHSIHRRFVITRWATAAVGAAGVGATIVQLGDSLLLGLVPLAAAVLARLVHRPESPVPAGLVLVLGCALGPVVGAFLPIGGLAMVSAIMWLTVAVLLGGFVLPLRAYVPLVTVILLLVLVANSIHPHLPMPAVLYVNGFLTVVAGATAWSLRFVEARDRQMEDRQEALERALEQARKRATELEQTRICLSETRSQLVHMGRLAALGEVSAEVAHELNNHLTTVLMSAEQLHDALSEGPLGPVAADVWDAAQGCSSVTERVLWFARRESGRAEPVRLSVVLARMEALVRASLARAGATLRLEQVHDAVVPGDQVQLTQVLVNLVLNAGSVMPAGGQVRVRLERVGSTARITVEDEGPGVPPELAERIFAPFFSTRTEDGGTGLGLAISRTVVEAHGGWITLQTLRPIPARFCVELPGAAAVEAVAPLAEAG